MDEPKFHVGIVSTNPLLIGKTAVCSIDELRHVVSAAIDGFENDAIGVTINRADRKIGILDMILKEQGARYLPVQYIVNRPKIVCLCGSTRFYEAFVEANFNEAMVGNIVLSVGFFLHRPEMVQVHGETVGITPEQKVALDDLHLRKIDIADEVLVLNVGDYIGESTRRELDYARGLGKVIRFLEEPKDD